jgi:hypothetical protein
MGLLIAAMAFVMFPVASTLSWPRPWEQVAREHPLSNRILEIQGRLRLFLPPTMTMFTGELGSLLSPEEIQGLFRNVETLDTYSQRPDCFRNAISRIRTRCSEFDMVEAERVRGRNDAALAPSRLATHATEQPLST